MISIVTVPVAQGGPSVGSGHMSRVTCQLSISLDGFVAGPDQSVENRLGEGGMRLHRWAFATASWREQQGMQGGERNADSAVIDEVGEGIGAYVM